MIDLMGEAMEESLGKAPPKPKAYFYWHWMQRLDDHGRVINAEWKPYILIATPAMKNQEVRRRATESDQNKYHAEWQAFTARSKQALENIRANLQTQVKAIDAMLPRKRGRPKVNKDEP